MRFRLVMLFTVGVSVAAGVGASWGKRPAVAWDEQASAKYLDAREVWWRDWPKAKRDQGTVCISCHTVVPYALARPGLRTALGETGTSKQEEIMLVDIRKRVGMWSEVKPFYDDPKRGSTRGVSARGTEAVLNALILASYDARAGKLSDVTRKAFDAAWGLQVTEGPEAGGWVWLDFHNTPWEGEGSPYQGATFAALAAGLAPGYAKEPENKAHLDLLRGYLAREYDVQPVANKLVLLWASSKLPGTITSDQKHALAHQVLALQQPDGGWSMNQFGTFKRHDGTPIETMSDGYATGLALLALESAKVGDKSADRRAALWLGKNQNPQAGSWVAYSLNKKRDPESDIGRFMTDAATAYATLALEQNASTR